GIDTVKLDGKGFKPAVSDGAHFKKGELLLKFEVDEIIKAGYDPTVMFIASELEDDSDVEVVTGEVKALEYVMNISEVK
nr:PTS glucose transporter subunit IIA [Oscillospiraceae bacterium]